MSQTRLGLEYSHKFNIMEDNLNIISKAEESMISAINHLEGELAKIRAGKANPIMLKNISVDYANQTPLTKLQMLILQIIKQFLFNHGKSPY